MTREGELGPDELRVVLHKIAATAGDPPEHGLARVAMKRRRRKRHRRGAVATAVALAVCGAAGGLLTNLGDREHDVSVAGDSDADGAEVATLPDLLSVHCSEDGIEVPVASIRPREDGLHIEVENATGEPLDLWVTSSAWDSGDVPVEPGQSRVRQPVPPGVLTVGCRIGGRDEQRRVDLVDEEGLYGEPSLACESDERTPLDDVELDEPSTSWSTTVRLALDDHMAGGDMVKPLDSYPDQRFGDPTADPMARVVRDEETVALVHLVPGSVESSWAGIRDVEACAGFLATSDETSDDRSPSSTTTTVGG